MDLHPVRQGLIGDGLTCLVVAAAAAVAIAALELNGPGWAGAAIGIVVFGVIEYTAETRRHVPEATLARPPGDAAVTSPARRVLKRLALALVVLVPVLWVAELLGLHEVSFVLPGAFLGIAAAQLIGAVQVARWERAHGERVMRSDVRTLYAVPLG